MVLVIVNLYVNLCYQVSYDKLIKRPNYMQVSTSSNAVIFPGFASVYIHRLLI